MGLFVLIVCNYKSYVTCEHHMFTGKAKCVRVMKVFYFYHLIMNTSSSRLKNNWNLFFLAKLDRLKKFKAFIPSRFFRQLNSVIPLMI